MSVGGIDIGMTNTLCCVFKSGSYECITEDNLNDIIPSIIGFDTTEVKYGTRAKESICQIPTAYEVKNIIGLQNIPEYINDSLCYYVNGNNGKTRIIFEPEDEIGLSIDPIIVYALYFRHLRKISEAKGCPISSVVITVPVTFSLNRIHAVTQATQLAGLNVLRIVYEPNAAAYAYCNDNQVQSFQKALIFDLGGGTFDLSLIEKSGPITCVTAFEGNAKLGGRNLDSCFAEYIMKNTTKNISRNSNQFFGLCRKAEELKIALSTNFSVTYDYKVKDLFREKEEHKTFSRKEFEDACKDILDLAISTCEDLLRKKSIDMKSINHVILVGGSSQIPYIQTCLKRDFKDGRVATVANPQTVVVRGAAMLAANETQSSAMRPPISIQHTYHYNIYISWPERDSGKQQIYYPDRDIEQWKYVIPLDEYHIYHNPPSKMYIHTEENGVCVCIGYFDIPFIRECVKYSFSMDKLYELHMHLLNADGNDCCERLSLHYFNDIDKQEEDNTKLIFSFLDTLNQIIKRLDASNRIENAFQIKEYCKRYLSFEKYYWLCRTKNDMNSISREYDYFKQMLKMIEQYG